MYTFLTFTHIYCNVKKNRIKYWRKIVALSQVKSSSLLGNLANNKNIS